MNDNDIKNCIFWTAQEVVYIFFHGKYNYQGVLRLTLQGKLPAIKVGKGYLYRKSELEHWADINFSTPAWSKIKTQ